MKMGIAGSVFGDLKRVGFFGIGGSNIAVMELLSELPSPPEVVLRSDKPIPAELLRSLPPLPPKEIFVGADALADIREKMLVLSPSVRRERSELKSAQARGVILTSDAELFFERAKVPLISVSGSDGKSTTVAMAKAMLGNRARMVGNIGIPHISQLSDTSSLPDYFVTEISSFTLRYAAPKSLAAAVTNVTPNHLNWHADLNEYVESKLKLYENAERRIINADDAVLCAYAKGKRAFAVFSVLTPWRELARRLSAEFYLTLEGGRILLNGKALLDESDISKRAITDIKNLMAATALTLGLTETDAIIKTAREFVGLPHRFERFATIGNTSFIDSSIDTSPTRTAATLERLKGRAVLILGGRGKGLSYEPLRRYLMNGTISTVIYGEERERIKEELWETGCEMLSFETPREAFIEAIRLGLELSAEAVLLSPAATSYDCFSSFEERGDFFKALVNSYKK